MQDEDPLVEVIAEAEVDIKMVDEVVRDEEVE